MTRNTQQELVAGNGASNSTSASKAFLSIDKKRQVVRLINPSDAIVKFLLQAKSDSLNENLEITPKNGLIPPRYFINITLDFKDTSKMNTANDLLLNIYYRFHSPKTGRELSTHTVPIALVSFKTARNNSKTFMWIAVRILRSTFLLVLIIYNISLIKSSLFS